MAPGRSVLFDAARFTYDWADATTKVDLIYANNSPESDRWLKPINDQDRGLMEQKEQAAILYLTNTSLKPIQLEGFFIYKQDTPLDHSSPTSPTSGARKARSIRSARRSPARTATTGSIGRRAPFRRARKSRFHRHAETVAATRHDVQAFGTLDTLEYLFKDPHDNATHVTYEYASGDDPGTANDEQFDLLWGRWPRWSELLIYTYANETRRRHDQPAPRQHRAPDQAQQAVAAHGRLPCPVGG